MRTERISVNNSQQYNSKFSSTGSSAAKCPHCDKEYATAYFLRTHIRTCHEPIECDVCGISNYGTTEAWYHKILKHMEPSYECAKCLKKFHLRANYHQHSAACNAEGNENGSLVSHNPASFEQIVTGNPSSVEASSTECSHCGIKESNVVNLVPHILTHHEPVACDLCGVTSSCLLLAQSHKEAIHKDLKNKCPHCSTHTWRGRQYQKHVLRCKDLKSVCDVCGKMFASKHTFEDHKKICRDGTVWNDRINISKKRGPKHIESDSSKSLHLPRGKTSQVRGDTDSSIMIKKISFPLKGLSESKCFFFPLFGTLTTATSILIYCSIKSKCYHCNEDFTAPGYLKHHLKKYHELTKCDICEITILGISSRKLHKVRCHTEPKFVCPACGMKFYTKGKYNQHWPHCKRNRNTCHICGHKFHNLNTLRRHQKNEHSERITLDETTISSQDDPEQSTMKPSSTVHGSAIEGIVNDCKEVCSSRQNSNNFEETELLMESRSSKHYALNDAVNDYHDTDSYMADNETKLTSVAALNDSYKEQVGSEKISQPLVENSSMQQDRRSICDDTFTEVSHIRQRKVKSRHKMVQCHLCARTLRIHDLDVHLEICADRRYSCDICNRKYKYSKDVTRHKKLYHHIKPTKKVIVGSTDCTAEHTSHSVEEKDIDKFSEKNGPHAACVELKMEIKVEATMLHEQDYLVPN